MATQILVADDDPVHLQLLVSALSLGGHQVHAARDPKEAIRQAQAMQPDLIILDVIMPEISGYDVCRQLRRRPEMAHVPIIMLTAQSSVEEKVKGFEAGADDYMTKPFQPAELRARVTALLRRNALAKRVDGKLISVFSMRGGVGVSTVAANLATGLAQIWEQPTVLVDLTPVASHSALLLNLSPRITWASLLHIPPEEIELEMVSNLLMTHASGASVLAAPRHLENSQFLTANQVSRILTLLRESHHYVVVDMPHDLRDTTVAALDEAQTIVALIGPDLGSVAVMRATLEFFDQRQYARENVRLALNQTCEQNALSPKQVEEGIKRPLDVVIPYSAEVLAAINLGIPLVVSAPTTGVGASLENLALSLSKEQHLNESPAKPSAAWQRVKTRKEYPTQGLRRFLPKSLKAKI